MDSSAMFLEPLQSAVQYLAVWLPRWIGAGVIVVVGWAAAVLLRGLCVRLLEVLQINRVAERAGLTEFLRRGAVMLSFGELVGMLVYWVILIATIILAIQCIGVPAAHAWLEQFGLFIPRLVIGAVIFLFGTFLAAFLGTSVRVASLNAGLPQGHLLGQAVSTTVVLVSVIIALEQLGVVTRTIEVALYILLGAFGLAFGLAVGLGAQDFVRRYFQELWDRWKTRS